MSEQNHEAQIKQLEARIQKLENQADAADLFIKKHAGLVAAQLLAGSAFVSALTSIVESQSKVRHSDMGLFWEFEMRTSAVLKEIIRALPEEHRGKVEHHLKSLSVLQDIIQQSEAENAAIQKVLLEKLKKIAGDQPPPPLG
jgi:hypothetical protein